LGGLLCEHGRKGPRVENYTHGPDFAVVDLLPFRDKGGANCLCLEITKETYIASIFKHFQYVNAFDYGRQFLDGVQIVVRLVKRINWSTEFQSVVKKLPRGLKIFPANRLLKGNYNLP
jgi:hypothetical protein